MTNTHRLWRRKLYLQRYLKTLDKPETGILLKTLEDNPQDWRKWTKSLKSIN